MKRCDEEFADDYVAAVHALVAGSRTSAAEILGKVPGTVNVFASKASAPSCFAQLHVFRRDGFQCRYCGRRTVFLPVLRALGRIFPDQLPWDPHGKQTNCHLAFWRDFASCDHLVPLARGGHSSVDNLVTACYMCNSIKQNWLIEELRWDLLEPEPGAWDGLVKVYSNLLGLLGKQDFAYHRRWLNALGVTPETAKAASANQ